MSTIKCCPAETILQIHVRLHEHLCIQKNIVQKSDQKPLSQWMGNVRGR